jgi:aminopeptidase N
MIRGWVAQPGFPLVKVGKDEAGLIFRQKRFAYLPLESEEIWQIPIQVLAFFENGKTTRLDMVLDKKTGSMILEPDVVAYKINYGQQGFFRTKYEEKEVVKYLGRAVKEGILPVPDRWGLQDDLYALLMRGDIPLPEYLEFIKSYMDEEAYLPLVGIGENLLHSWLVFEGNDRDSIGALGKELLEGSLVRIGMEPETGEDLSVSRLRDQLLWMAARFGSQKALSFGQECFENLENGKTVHPDILGAVLRIAALENGNRAFEWFEERLAQSESEFERTTVLEAMGCFGDKETILRTLSYVIDRVPARNKFVPVAKMATNPTALENLWDWFSSNYDIICGFHPLHHERIITYTIPLGGLGRAKEVIDFFKEGERSAKGRAADVIRLSLEKLQINERMRASRSAH